MLMSGLSSLIFQTNRIIDGGGHASLNEVEDAIENHRALQFLEEQYPEKTDLSLHRDRDALDEINEVLERYHLGTGPHEYGTENNGLCYLVALLTETIQTGDDWEWGATHDNPPR